MLLTAGPTDHRDGDTSWNGLGRFEIGHNDSLLRREPVCGTITASVFVMGCGERPAHSTLRRPSVFAALAALFMGGGLAAQGGGGHDQRRRFLWVLLRQS